MDEQQPPQVLVTALSEIVRSARRRHRLSVLAFIR
jgi:hypothetical protein